MFYFACFKLKNILTVARQIEKTKKLITMYDEHKLLDLSNTRETLCTMLCVI